MIVRRPARITDAGALRSHFTHLIHIPPLTMARSIVPPMKARGDSSV
jgi:hypothetical protein